MKRRKTEPDRAMRGSAYLTTAELAARWNLTEGHLRNRRVAGRAPPFFADGGVIRYSISDIEKHEADHTVTSTTVSTNNTASSKQED